MKPSYKEFEELVKIYFSKIMPDLNAGQTDDFLKSEDAQDTIMSEYKYSEKRFDSGIISSAMFRTGSASAAASCLYMLY